MKKLSLVRVDLCDGYVLSWLPTQDNDIHYPIKDVTAIVTNEVGKVERGYRQTDMKMTKDEIIEHNLRRYNIKEKDRMIIESMSMRNKLPRLNDI